ncbi:hypothetical protein ABEB36_011213 [Hypothenemus hampei]|uniref:F-box domain-containing protein n=1 Tax=Hypothenemus hampei TaxID=57062 RepID=A0ABD1EEN0_HYPHA
MARPRCPGIKITPARFRFKTDRVFSAPDFPKYRVWYRTVGPSDVLVQPIGRLHDHRSYRCQDNPLGAEHWFTFQFVGPINMTNFKMHPSWEEANVVVRIWGAWIDQCKGLMKGNWHLFYETSHSMDPSENYKECSELITTIRIEFNRNIFMHNWTIRKMQTATKLMISFPLFFPLSDKVLYEEVKIFTGNVIPENELEVNWNGKNFTEALPTEILYNIFEYLDLRSLSRCAQVNKRWNSIASDLHFYQEVDLRMYWDKINMHTLRTLKNKLQIVRKLDMTWCHDSILTTSPEHRDSLISILEAAKNTLTHLCLNHTHDFLSKVTMQQILDCPNLEELRLRKVDWSNTNGWSESCKELLCLKTLDVNNSFIKQNDLIEILKRAPNLEHLLLDDCVCLDNIDPIITTVVEHSPKLKSWTSSNTFLFKDNYRAYEKFGKLIHLEYLDLNFGEPRPYKIYCNWLESIAMNCKRLKRLELGCWLHLTDNDLVSVLTHCKELSYLYLLGSYNISIRTLSMACENLPNLRHICVFKRKEMSKEVVEDLAESYKHVKIYPIKYLPISVPQG